MQVPVTVSHPYRPGPSGTQCVWCWGWVDDPRHPMTEPTDKKAK